MIIIIKSLKKACFCYSFIPNDFKVSMAYTSLQNSNKNMFSNNFCRVISLGTWKSCRVSGGRVSSCRVSGGIFNKKE